MPNHKNGTTLTGKAKLIAVLPSTKKRLDKLKKSKEPYYGVIDRLIDEHEDGGGNV